MQSIYSEMREKEIIFLGYHMFDQERKRVQEVYGYDKKHTIENNENIPKRRKITFLHPNDQDAEFSVIREEKIDLDMFHMEMES